MDYRYLILPSAILILFLIAILLFHFKKKAVIKKVNALSTQDKETLLNTLAQPIGYRYDSYQDIFIARLDAPQKRFGYTSFYDRSAAYLNMIFDYETFYFDYLSKTWLIQIWKGQYGINTGCELGIYYADTLVSPDEYATTHFHAVSPKDMLDISLILNVTPSRKHHKPLPLGHVSSRHWWLTIFKMGTFTKPENILVDVSIRFKDFFMMQKFLESFKATLPDTEYRTNGLTVYFSFLHSYRKYSFFKRMVRHIALAFCKLYCKWFHFITRAFQRSDDKLLYLYYYLPFFIRLIFKKKASN